MVRKFLISLAICTPVWATEDGLTPTLRPLILPALSSLEVVQHSVQAEPNQEDCKTFTLTEQDVRNYFAQADQIDHGDFTEVVEWSACQATGTVEFDDGSRANWRLQRYRAGQLVYPDGREVYMYCERCGAPFE